MIRFYELFSVSALTPLPTLPTRLTEKTSRWFRAFACFSLLFTIYSFFESVKAARVKWMESSLYVVQTRIGSPVHFLRPHFPRPPFCIRSYSHTYVRYTIYRLSATRDEFQASSPQGCNRLWSFFFLLSFCRKTLCKRTPTVFFPFENSGLLRVCFFLFFLIKPDDWFISRT